MLNRVIMMGRLVRDPELKTTPSGVNVANFRIAVDRNFVKKGDERQSDFFDVVCWRHTAEFVCKYFGKGNLVAVEGQLQTRTYQAKDGSTRTAVEIVADNISFTGERPEDRHTSFNQSAPVAAPTSMDSIMDTDDDPFTWGSSKA